jgi:hypothetical protein
MLNGSRENYYRQGQRDGEGGPRHGDANDSGEFVNSPSAVSRRRMRRTLCENARGTRAPAIGVARSGEDEGADLDLPSFRLSRRASGEQQG